MALEIKIAFPAFLVLWSYDYNYILTNEMQVEVFSDSLSLLLMKKLWHLFPPSPSPSLHCLDTDMRAALQEEGNTREGGPLTQDSGVSEHTPQVRGAHQHCIMHPWTL